MGWYPECCEDPEAPCSCPGKMLLTVSGATDKKCSNNVSGTWDKQLVNGTYTVPCSGLGVVTPIVCSTMASHNPDGSPFDPGAQRYDADLATCSTLTSIRALNMFLDSDGYLWTVITNQRIDLVGFVLQTVNYIWNFKSDDVFINYSPGDTVTFSYVGYCSQVSSGSDPGVNEMPFDASTCTVSALYVGCCPVCDDVTPNTYIVELDEPADDNGLTDCASIAGSYELQRTSNVGTCVWSLCSNAYDGGSVFVMLEKYWLLGTLYTKVTVRQYTQPNCAGSILHTAVFEKSYTSSNYGLIQNCDEEDTVIPFSFESGFGCDFSGVQCLLTAVLA